MEKPSRELEVDLSKMSQHINDFSDRILTAIYNLFLFAKRNLIILLLLIVLGGGLGVYLDQTSKVYDNEIIVTPNFGSNDYLYGKIALINSKIKENDTTFLKNEVGFKYPKLIKKIKIEPITDVYQFIAGNEVNFELIKLMAESDNIKKILEDNVTSKNYMYHAITFRTSGSANSAAFVEPLMSYLNETDYYKQVQVVHIENIKAKIKENERIITQIDGILDRFSNNTINGHQSDKLIYYNENTQLNDVIKSKESLVSEQGLHRLSLINYNRVIKDISSTINIRNMETISGHMKFILPVVFISLFAFGYILVRFFKSQAEKSKN